MGEWGVPLPRWVARFNKRVTNRFMEPLARRFSNFAVVEHRGRTSGLVYRTPINLFEQDGRFIAALTYGPGADWVRNVLAGGGSVEIRGEVRPISAANVVDRATAWPALPLIVRFALRVLRVVDFLALEPEPIDEDVTSQ